MEVVSIADTTVAAVAVFTCRPNSHPFQERHISLHEPVKIGRSVARARPAPNNAIFDCKVLSRNHALLWYEGGKFFLQDTKSSNGTFINNQRLSKGSEESPPREIFSGDMVQFGVDVMENSRRVTHGCIIASIQLFFPDGREATASHSSPYLGSVPGAGPPASSQELYQLAQYLHEALHREQMLEAKLATLQRLIANSQEASETGWQALIDEDRLLSRLEVLENQLQTYSKNQTEETLRQELVALQEDKYNYETTAKESLRKVLQEKLDAVRKLSELESSLSNTEDECGHLKDMCETSQKELQELAEKHQEQIQEINSLQEKLQEAERQHQEEMERAEKEKSDLQAKLDDMVKEEEVLSAKVEALQADNDFTKEQLTNMKVRMEAIKEKSDDSGDEGYIPEFESQATQVDLVNMLDLQLLQGAEDDEDEESEEDTEENAEKIREKLKETKKIIEKYKNQLKDSEIRLRESKEHVEKLQSQLEQAEIEIASYVAKISSIEVQLNESRKQSENSGELTRQLKDEILKLEGQIHQYRLEADQRNLPSDSNDVTNSNSIPNHIENHSSSPTPNSSANNHLKEEVERLKELLQEARDSQRKSEAEVIRVKGDLEEAQRQVKKSADDAKQLQHQLCDAQRTAKDRSDHITNLQEQLNKAETTTKEVKTQILALREQLQEAQQTAKQSHNEAEQLRTRCKIMQEELELTPEVSTNLGHSPNITHTEMQRQQARNKVEFATLKEECANLRRRIQDIESDMKEARHDNQQLQGDYVVLQESYKELEALKDRLQGNEMTWKINLTDAQKESDITKRQLIDANNEISQLKDKCSQYKEEISQLKTDLTDMTEEFQLLSYKSKTLSTCSMIPLLLLVFAIMLGFYPALSTITATHNPT